MKTVSSLLDQDWLQRYQKISKLNIRSSIYDVTSRCNLRCKGCFFFSSGEDQVAKEEMDVAKWEAFIDAEKSRGVNLAILIGGEPTLCLDRVELFYKRMPSFCATNGLIKVPRDQFPDMMIGISLWGDENDEKTLRGKDTFAISSNHYAGDPHAYYLYTITPKQIGKTEQIVKKIRDVGLKVHMQLLSNDEGVDGFFGKKRNSRIYVMKWTQCWMPIRTRLFLQNIIIGSLQREKCWTDLSDGWSALPSPSNWTTERLRPNASFILPAGHRIFAPPIAAALQRRGIVQLAKTVPPI
jgi:organic radical activating enzyme